MKRYSVCKSIAVWVDVPVEADNEEEAEEAASDKIRAWIRTAPFQVVDKDLLPDWGHTEIYEEEEE